MQRLTQIHVGLTPLLLYHYTCVICVLQPYISNDVEHTIAPSTIHSTFTHFTWHIPGIDNYMYSGIWLYKCIDNFFNA